jgi:aspartate aminotransferase-like enzyme
LEFSKELCEYTGAQNVAFLTGSGSLGNEVIASYLSKEKGKGLILCNGEFGKRLINQATQMGLDFISYNTNWKEFSYPEIERIVDENKIGWVWFVHCETSTGILNDMDKLKKICLPRGIKLCADCISSIGNLKVDLKGMYLVSNASGKGIGSYAGISMVYYDDRALEVDTRGIPRYFDLKYNKDCRGIPFTLNTNLFYALRKAFSITSPVSHREHIRRLSNWMFDEIEKMGITLFWNRDKAMPGVFTFILPKEINSYELGREFEEAGFWLNYGSAYLREANMIQAFIMGYHTQDRLMPFIEALQSLIPAKVSE